MGARWGQIYSMGTFYNHFFGSKSGINKAILFSGSEHAGHFLDSLFRNKKDTSRSLQKSVSDAIATTKKENMKLNNLICLSGFLFLYKYLSWFWLNGKVTF